MIETLDELLKHFKFKKYIDFFYIKNSTDDIEKYYTLQELIEYGDYRVDDWKFDLEENKLTLEISYDK